MTEGKIYIEIERARLTKRLARIKEDEGNVDEAADVLQEVAVVRRSPLQAPDWPVQWRQLSHPLDYVQHLPIR